MADDNLEPRKPLATAVAAAQDSRSRIARASLQINNAIAQVSDPVKLEEIAKGLEGAADFIRNAAGVPKRPAGPSTVFETTEGSGN